MKICVARELKRASSAGVSTGAGTPFINGRLDPDPHVIFQKVKKSAFSHYFCMDIK
jgi:hypothetical protein